MNEVALREYLKQLEGCIITGTDVVEMGDGELWPRLEIGRFPAGAAQQLMDESSDRRTISVAGDEEGNTPGFIHGLPETPAGMAAGSDE